jgi:hypothetical protein
MRLVFQSAEGGGIFAFRGTAGAAAFEPLALRKV